MPEFSSTNPVAKPRDARPGKSAVAKAAPLASAPAAGAASAPQPLPPAAEIVVPHVPDRWEQMRSEIASCASEGLFARVVCEQRVRLRYCENYWGKVDECAGSRQGGYEQ